MQKRYIVRVEFKYYSNLFDLRFKYDKNKQPIICQKDEQEVFFSIGMAKKFKDQVDQYMVRIYGADYSSVSEIISIKVKWDVNHPHNWEPVKK